jgi:glycerol-3-phosphate dehydrogenase
MPARPQQLTALQSAHFDVLVIGGGINGAVSAAALAGHGARVALVERGDFAGSTSEHSSNLAWGGIKYLETFEFRLVRQLCRSRNELMRQYPSTVREIRFLTTLERGFRHHPLKLWMGVWLYWLMGDAFTRTPRLFSAEGIQREEPVIQTRHSVGGFEYSDAYLFDNDARFVFGFIRAAAEAGATVANYVEVTHCRFVQDHWQVEVVDRVSGQSHCIQTRFLVNAAGPQVDRLNDRSGVTTQHRHVFSKGIHLIVPRLTRQDRVLAFFASDGRPFFVIPMGDRTCIGTTDTRVEDPETQVSAADRQFVLDNINRCLQLPVPLQTSDILAERCGVRPLAVRQSATARTAQASADFLQLSRKHALDAQPALGHVSIFGGKLTDCLNVGAEVCTLLRSMGLSLTQSPTRWFGEPDAAARQAFLDRAEQGHLERYAPPGLNEPLAERLWRRYGLAAHDLLSRILEDPAQGENLLQCAPLLRVEVEYAAAQEMIVHLEDFLRRRTMLSQIRAQETLRTDPGLREVCTLLFGEQAEEEYRAYFAHPETP